MWWKEKLDKEDDAWWERTEAKVKQNEQEKTPEERIAELEKYVRYVERWVCDMWATSEHLLCIVCVLAVVVALLCAHTFLKLF